MIRYHDIYLTQGTDFDTTISLKDDDYQPINIANYEFTSKVRKGPLTSIVAGIFTCNVSNSQNGIVRVRMNAANTKNIEMGRYFYDIFYTNANTTNVIVQGSVIVSAGISN